MTKDKNYKSISANELEEIKQTLHGHFLNGRTNEADKLMKELEKDYTLEDMQKLFKYLCPLLSQNFEIARKGDGDGASMEDILEHLFPLDKSPPKH